MVRLALLLASWLLLTGCGCPRYPLNIGPERDVEARIREAARWVDDDQPPGALATEEGFHAFVFKNTVTEHPVRVPTARAHELDPKQAEIWQALGNGEIRSVYYPTVFRGLDIWHQVTAATLEPSFDDFSRRFDLAYLWGVSLAGYRGGALTVDRRDRGGRATLQRERMVLGTPWYAFGPDLDMSKHELIDRAPSRLQVSWIVTASENRSVGVDFGYLLLRSIRVDGRLKTLMVFNSVHQIDAGPLAGLDADLVGSGVSDTFVAHLSRYRELFAPL